MAFKTLALGLATAALLGCAALTANGSSGQTPDEPWPCAADELIGFGANHRYCIARSDVQQEGVRKLEDHYDGWILATLPNGSVAYVLLECSDLANASQLTRTPNPALATDLCLETARPL